MHSEHSEHRKKAALFLGVVGHHHTVVIPADDWRAVVIQIKTIQKVLFPYRASLKTPYTNPDRRGIIEV